MRPKRLKLHKDGAVYHIMTRTAQQLFLFDDAVKKEWIYKKILWLSSIYYVTLHSVAVLDNHYHIVLSIGKPDRNDRDLRRRWRRAENSKKRRKQWREELAGEWHQRLGDLSEFAKELNQSTAMFFNQKYKKHGHVWGDRFKSVLVESGKGLLATMTYVEMNPVRAGICKSPKEYRWCSAGRFHQGGTKASGVKIPKLPGFKKFKKNTQKQKGFFQLIDQIAMRNSAKVNNHYNSNEFEIQLDNTTIDQLLTLVIGRTRWITSSLVLGGTKYCREIINHFNLQSSLSSAKPYPLLFDLFNSRQRAGPQPDL